MRKHHSYLVASFIAFALTGVSAARAQSTADPSGHWEGSVQIPGNSVPFAIDLARDSKGQWIGAFTGADVKGLPLTKIAVTGPSVMFQANSEQPFNGELSADGKTLAGTIILSGYSLPLAMTRTGDGRVDPLPTSAPIGRNLEGTWEGTLQASRGPMRLVLTMTNEANGRATGRVVSVDEGGLLLPVVITQNGSKVSYAMTVLTGSWAGELSGDGKELSGTYTQGETSLPLTFHRAESGKQERQ
jgi:hypothetical protein